MKHKSIKSNNSIILPIDYLNRINAFKCIDVLGIGEEDYLSFIEKDFTKDFCCQMIDRGIELTWGHNLLDHYIEFDSPTHYIILNVEDLYDFLQENIYLFFSDFVDVLDFEESKKFEILYNLIKETKPIYAIKVTQVLREIRTNPIIEHRVNSAIDWVSDYKYNF